MIATPGPVKRRTRTDDIRARVPQRAFGNTEWVTLALQASAQHLEPAILSGQPYRIANALRAVVHVPTVEQRNGVIAAVCDSLLAEAYATRSAHMINCIAEARPIMDRVLAELDADAARTSLEPPLLRETVDGFIRMAALVDKRLADRLDATGRFAARIATVMALPSKLVLDVEFAGRLHDIGMIGIAGTRAKDDVNGRKVRGLKSHTIVGEGFVHDVPALAHLAPIVRSHHERFDGSGFPDGLRGHDIPLEARIVGVAAAFVERVTATPQHDALLPQDACQELALHAGTHFDPDVVEAALQLLRFRQRTNRSA